MCSMKPRMRDISGRSTPQHSREFRAYIERPGATTIPLTFNLRGPDGDGWTLSHRRRQWHRDVEDPKTNSPDCRRFSRRLIVSIDSG